MSKLVYAVLLASVLAACGARHDADARKAEAQPVSAAQDDGARGAAAESGGRSAATDDVPYPYAAIITCSTGSMQFDLIQCFSGTSSRPDTNLELRNGDKYDLYQPSDLDRLGQRFADGVRIELSRNFEMTMQNASDSLVLGVKIVNNVPSPDFGKVLFEKKAGEFGVIKVSN